MEKERTLVLIKPDAMVKGLAGEIIGELSKLNLKMIGLKLVNVKRELAEQHYEEHKSKPFFEELIQHITGALHNQENVIAIAYEGIDAIKKVRELAGATNPDDALPQTLRGKYGKINTKNKCHETVIHGSDSPSAGKREVALWFDEKELII